MFKLDYNGMLFSGLVLEGLLYGLYSGLFAMYIQYQELRKDTYKKPNFIFYSISTLYVFSAALFAIDIARPIHQYLGKPVASGLVISFVEMTLFGCCDFIAQFILIYRCWIVWGRNIRVVIVPSILAFAFLGVWLGGGGSLVIISGEVLTPPWGYFMTLSALALSLTVNALVTGLIVFRIVKVFWKVRKANSGDLILGATGGSRLRRVVLILIESGMALFSIQLVRVVVSILVLEGPAFVGALSIITSIHNLLNGITPTIILVRTSIGLSFHDEKSMEEVATGTLRLNHRNSVQETESTTVVDQDNRDADIDVKRSNATTIVEVER